MCVNGDKLPVKFNTAKDGAFCPVILLFYFFIAENSAQIHPITDQPSNQLPMRILVISVLSFFVWRARYAGAQKIKATKTAATMYFIMIMFSGTILSSGGCLVPRPFLFIIYHISQNFPVLLLFLSVGYILPCDLCGTWIRF